MGKRKKPENDLKKKRKKRKLKKPPADNQATTQNNNSDSQHMETENTECECPDGQCTCDTSSESSNDGEATKPGDKNPEKKASKIKLPPIIITSAIDQSHYIKKLKNHFNDPNIKFHCTREGLKIFANTEKQFSTMINSLKSEKGKAEFYYHPLPNDKLKHLVLKGLPDLDITEIQEDLKNQGYEPTRVVKMKTKADLTRKVRNPFFMISYKHEVNLKDVRNIRYICSIKVTWDKYRNTRKVTQCHRCQGFGHGTIGCNRFPRCVKCAENHLTAECKLTDLTNPKCVNCKENHTANFSGCKVYQDRLQVIEKQRALRSRVSNLTKRIAAQTTDPPTNVDPPQNSYSSRLKSNSHQTTELQETQKLQECDAKGSMQSALARAKENYDNITQLNDSFSKLEEVCNLKEMCMFVNTLVEHMKHRTTKVEKLQGLLEFFSNDGEKATTA